VQQKPPGGSGSVGTLTVYPFCELSMGELENHGRQRSTWAVLNCNEVVLQSSMNRISAMASISLVEFDDAWHVVITSA
jgi:hypothetical protein